MEIPFRLRPVPAVALAIVLTVSLAVTDYLTGPQISFSIFYLIPVSLAVLGGGARAGYALALLCSVAWFLAEHLDEPTYAHPLIPYWNACVRMGYFALHVALLSGLLGRIRQEADSAREDSLTRAANGRGFRESVAIEIARARRTGRPFTAAVVDLDNFKEVNDQNGHEAGDAVLVEVAAAARGALRPPDCVGRIGGDEFAVLLPETAFDEGREVLDRVQTSLREAMTRGGWPVDFSIGGVTFDVPPPVVEGVLVQADRLMYAVKRSGKGALRHERWPAATTSHAASANRR